MKKIILLTLLLSACTNTEQRTGNYDPFSNDSIDTITSVGNTVIRLDNTTVSAICGLDPAREFPKTKEMKGIEGNDWIGYRMERMCYSSILVSGPECKRIGKRDISERLKVIIDKFSSDITATARDNMVNEIEKYIKE